MLDVTHRGDIAVLMMTHGKANALDTELCRHIAKRLEELGTSSARAVILTGRGKIFSAGVDLLRVLDGGAAYLRDFLPTLRKLFDVVFFYHKPIVAAVNGHAIAGGCVLACAADKRLMARGPGRIGVTELLVGLAFPAIALEIMRFVAASHHFEEIIFSGATYPPEAAGPRGLIDASVEQDALMERAMAAAQALAALSPAAFALSKSHSRQPVLNRLQTDGPAIDKAVDEVWLSSESTARVRDYVTRTFKKI